MRANRRKLKLLGVTFVAAAAVPGLGVEIAVSATKPKPPELVSRSPAGGAAANGESMFPSVSADGRLVAFRSRATNLSPDDLDSERDVFVRNLATGEVELASRATGATGAKGNRASFNPRISADGRFVVFRSNANNLVPEDTDRVEDVYLRDLRAQTTTLVSRASTAVGAKGDAGSFNPSISADGRLVAFRSESSNLTPDDTDSLPDIFVRDIETATTTLVSRASGPEGAKGIGASEFPVISADGSRVAFRSESPNLAPADADAVEDIFVRDLISNETILVSRGAGQGAKGDGRSTFASISADGRFVAFDTLATNISPDDRDAAADVYLRDLKTGALTLVSRGSGPSGAKANHGSAEPSVSADGRFVAFHSVATNLDHDDRDEVLDVFVRDMATARTEVLSAAVTAEAKARSYEPQISANGRTVAFHSDADNLSRDDLGATPDVFAAAVPRPERCLGRRATTYAGPDAFIRGTRRSDVVVAADDSVRISAGKGRDRICAGDGNDIVKGGRGADKITGAGGEDRISGGGGRDKLVGNGGVDELGGGRGSDRLLGGGGRDRLRGRRGADRLNGGSGRDRCAARYSEDHVKRCEKPKRGFWRTQ